MIMHDLTSLELGMVIAELKPKLIGGYLKKFYDLGNDSFRFSFHNASGNIIVYCNLMSTFNETSFSEEAGAATNFAIAMRRRIEDSKVIGISQYGSDRIAIIELQGKGTVYRVVMEMFGKGNLILLNADGKIELCYKNASYKDREIKPKRDYIFPKSEAVPLEKVTDEAIVEMLDKVVGTKGKIIAELSKYLNIGPIYLEDLIVSAGLDPRAKLDPKDIGRLSESITNMLQKVGAPDPVLYYEGDSVVDYAVFPLGKYVGARSEKCGSLSEMLDRANISERGKSTEAGPQRREFVEIDSSITKQRHLVDEFNRNSVVYADSGKKIFERMNEINALVARIREMKKPDLQRLKEEFPDLNVTEINMKDKKVTIEI